MPKSKPPLRLVPSGAKLSEVINNVNLLGALFMPFMIKVVSESPRLKREMLSLLADTRANVSLTREQQVVLNEAISFVEQIVTE